MKLSSPLVFYNIMMGFFVMCFLYDVTLGEPSPATYAWPVCFIYYYFRRLDVKGMIEKDSEEFGEQE